MSVTASIIVEASKKKSTTFKSWSDYIDRWCETNGMPDEIKTHLYETIIPSLNALKK
jgi:transposase-like protein